MLQSENLYFLITIVWYNEIMALYLQDRNRRGMLSVQYDSGTWRIETQIGEGSFGKVFKVSRDEQGQKRYAALKIMPVPQSSEISQLSADKSGNTHIGDMAKNIQREIDALQEEDSPFIVRYDDFNVLENERVPGRQIKILMPLMESVEKTFISRNLCEQEAINIGMDICQALEMNPLRKT
jgi:serine/threonine protein kinase